MKHFDEELIKMRQAFENEKYTDINEGISVHGQFYEFEKVELLNGNMSIMLPKDFVEMPIRMKKIKYPSNDRPQIIKTDLNGQVDFTFNYLELTMKEEQLEKIVQQMKMMTKKLMPQYTFGEDYFGNTQSGAYYGYEYMCNVLDGKLYTYVYGTCINERFMQGGFSCLIQDKNLWKEAVLQVCQSIQDLRK